MEPIGLWAFDWLCPKNVIAALAAATPPVSIVSLPTLLVSVTVSVFMEQGPYPSAQPPTWRTRGSLFVWSLPYQEYKTPADIALGVIETSKLPHHDEVVTPFGAETGSHYSQ